MPDGSADTTEPGRARITLGPPRGKLVPTDEPQLATETARRAVHHPPVSSGAAAPVALFHTSGSGNVSAGA